MSVELLAPAGNMEKLKMAMLYGADAVYLSGERFGLRAGADNFSQEELAEAMEYVHNRNKKAYVTLNVLPHNQDFAGMEGYIRYLAKISADAVIVSDPGVFSLVKETAPELPVHISTQANVTNTRSARFWQKQGASRIIAARELSLKELSQIHHELPSLELEAFVHGAMCISYSGRCLLSNFMCGRDANRGDCAHPCRWKYYLMEESRPGEYFPVEEDSTGTFILNSKDLCMIGHIPELVQSGVASLKIEGRIKSSFYVATIVRAYRMALDSYLRDPAHYVFQPALLEEVSKVSHRSFTTGFFLDKPGPGSQNYGTSNYVKTWEFVGVVRNYDEQDKTLLIEQRNRILKGDEVEIVQPNGCDVPLTVGDMWDMEGNLITSAPHPQMLLTMKLGQPVRKDSMLRKKLS
jgi:putative protease